MDFLYSSLFLVLFDSTVPTSGGLLAGFQFKCITGVEINNMATVNAVMEMKFYVHLCEISLNSHSSYICSCVSLCVSVHIYGYVVCMWLDGWWSSKVPKGVWYGTPEENSYHNVCCNSSEQDTHLISAFDIKREKRYTNLSHIHVHLSTHIIVILELQYTVKILLVWIYCMILFCNVFTDILLKQ